MLPYRFVFIHDRPLIEVIVTLNREVGSHSIEPNGIRHFCPANFQFHAEKRDYVKNATRTKPHRWLIPQTQKPARWPHRKSRWTLIVATAEAKSEAHSAEKAARDSKQKKVVDGVDAARGKKVDWRWLRNWKWNARWTDGRNEASCDEMGRKKWAL